MTMDQRIVVFGNDGCKIPQNPHIVHFERRPIKVYVKELIYVGRIIPFATQVILSDDMDFKSVFLKKC